jgi:tRNA modification GTPase
VVNKIDLSGDTPGRVEDGAQTVLRVSARTGAGIDALRGWLLASAGWQPAGEGLFLARERHLSALRRAQGHLAAATDPGITVDLVAEELRLAHDALGDIVGRVTADDLLGAIFSRFCIGK